MSWVSLRGSRIIRVQQSSKSNGPPFVRSIILEKYVEKRIWINYIYFDSNNLQSHLILAILPLLLHAATCRVQNYSFMLKPTAQIHKMSLKSVTWFLRLVCTKIVTRVWLYFYVYETLASGEEHVFWGLSYINWRSKSSLSA